MSCVRNCWISFGLCDLTTDYDLDRRVDIVERRNAFEYDPERFCAGLAQDQSASRQDRSAQKNSDSVIVERPLLRKIAQLAVY